MAGLLATRVLAERFDAVVVLDKDVLPDTAVPRRGVPQGCHVHVLLASGLRIIKEHFPGIAGELTEAGALPAWGGWYLNGGYLLPAPEGLRGITASRPLIEGVVCHRLMQLGNVRIAASTTVRQIGSTPDRSRITGVTVTDATGQSFLDADLVVDATGRGSRAARWLEELGYARPAEERIAIPITYVTRCFRRAPSDLDGDTFEMVGSDQPCHRGGLMVAIEGGRWIVTLTGYGDQVPPQDMAGFIAYARSLPVQRMGDLVSRAEPLDEGSVFRFPASLRRHWERLARLPDGFVVTGDSLCSFNPVFGQGMTVAAQESQALATALTGPHSGLARRFYRAAARLVDRPWAVAAGTDLQHPNALGRRSVLTGMVNGYMNRLGRAAQRDPLVATRLYEALNLLIPSTGLFRPDIVVRTLRYGGSPTG
jgi:2-polyprenyl-6-methoxyphenol hydroxylase-like FAD-dependent oxidoreductase